MLRNKQIYFGDKKENDVLFVSLHLLQPKNIFSNPSKHAGSDSNPVRIGWEELARSGPDDSCHIGLLPARNPFDQNLTQSARTKSHPRWFCTILSGTSAEERNRVWKWETDCIQPETGPDDSCTPACFLTRFVWPNPDQTIQIRSGSVFCTAWPMPSLEKRNSIGCGKSDLAWLYDPARFLAASLAVTAGTGCNQNASGSDPAKFTGIMSRQPRSQEWSIQQPTSQNNKPAPPLPLHSPPHTLTPLSAYPLVNLLTIQASYQGRPVNWTDNKMQFRFD